MSVGVAEGAEFGADPTPDLLRKQLVANGHALVDEIDAFLDPPHDRAVPMPYGGLPVALALDVFAMEAGLHTSDLAAALGEDDRLEPDVCRPRSRSFKRSDRPWPTRVAPASSRDRASGCGVARGGALRLR